MLRPSLCLFDDDFEVCSFGFDLGFEAVALEDVTGDGEAKACAGLFTTAFVILDEGIPEFVGIKLKWFNG